MKFGNPTILGLTAALALAGGIALAQAPTPPLVQVLGPNDLIQVVPGGAPGPGAQYATTTQLAGYGASLPSKANVLIGGDATTNAWQRATTGASVTTTATYGGPDRWIYWSGTNTAMTVSRDSTAADLPATGYLYGFKMARTSGQTGVVQVCMLQEVESANVYQFQGQTAELDFHAVAGANFSAASGNLVAYIITGTGTDEGTTGAGAVTFGLNAGGGGSVGWAGQANATAAVIPISTTIGRYAAVAAIPATTKEMAVAICFTPVGTAGTNDYVALSGIQLTRNASLVGKVSATAGYACSQQTGGTAQFGVQCTSFDRTRTAATELALQQRYYYAILESATSGAQQSAAGNGATTTTCQLYFPFPVNMRVAPTFAALAAFSTSTFTITHIATATALATPYLAVLGANTVNGGSVTATVASGLTTGQTCVLTSANGSGSFGWSAEL